MRSAAARRGIPRPNSIRGLAERDATIAQQEAPIASLQAIKSQHLAALPAPTPSASSNFVTREELAELKAEIAVVKGQQLGKWALWITTGSMFAMGAQATHGLASEVD